MTPLILFNLIVLWIHLLSAVLFVGGSYFMWLVVVPASHLMTEDESERTQIVGKIAKQFGKLVNPTLIVLILTGAYNATWYVYSYGPLTSYPGTILLTKIVLAAVLVLLIYVNNVYFGKLIMRLGKERKYEELRQVRRTSKIISIANLTLMTIILLLAVIMQTPP